MNVLIVESAQHVRDGNGLRLAGQGHHVIACASGRDALLRADSYEVDLLATGDWLPDMARSRLVDQLRRSSSHPAFHVLAIQHVLVDESVWVQH